MFAVRTVRGARIAQRDEVQARARKYENVVIVLRNSVSPAFELEAWVQARAGLPFDRRLILVGVPV